MAEKTAAEKKSKNGRSPRYPGVDLGHALELAKIVYGQTKQNSVAAETVFHIWNMKPKSGKAKVMIAALKQFGLLEVLTQRGLGSSKVKVSELAFKHPRGRSG